VLAIGPDDVTFSVAKFFFAYGLGNTLTFPFSVGASTVLDRSRPSPTGTLRVLRDFRPTLFFGGPTYFANASTQTFDSSECQADLTVDATYTDGAGRTQRSGSEAIGFFVTWFAEEVGTHLEVTHTVQYFRDCVSGCFVSFTTSPK